MRVALLFGFLLVGCAPKAIESIKDTGERAGKRAEQQAERLDHITQIKRQVDGIDLQTKILAAIDASGSDRERVALARIYFRAFEFQKWTGVQPDTPAFKHELYDRALRVFLPLAAGRFPARRPLRQWILTDDWRETGVLAAVMDEVDSDQKESAARTGVAAESIYSLIERALTDPSATGGFVEFARAWRRECVYLLQVRQNYLLVLAAERLNDLEGGYEDQLRSLVAEAAVPSPDLLREVREYASRAQATRALLRRLGEEPKLNPNVRWRFERATVGLPEVRAMGM